MSDVATITTASPSATRQLMLAERIADPMDAIGKLGIMLAQSKMLGCKNDNQGMLLAMHCLTEGTSPLTILREFHLVGGNLTMKADVMMAKFRQAGGTHEIVERSPDRVAIKMGWKRKTYTFEFTWAEAKVEAYVYQKDGTTPKDNWGTPRRRMQMMWARLISDSVRAVAPECVAGHYTPEDLGVISDPVAADEDEIVAEFTVIDGEAELPKTKAAMKAAVAGSQETPVSDEPESPPADDPPFDMDTTTTVPLMITAAQLKECGELKDQLGYGKEIWDKVCDHFEVKSARDLTKGAAEKLLVYLRDKVDAGDSKKK